MSLSHTQALCVFSFVFAVSLSGILSPSVISQTLQALQEASRATCSTMWNCLFSHPLWVVLSSYSDEYLSVSVGLSANL